MKLIIIESGDRLGKNSLIKGLCEHLNYDNISIRHFGKPPMGLTPKEILKFQFSMFNNELDLFYYMNARDYNKHKYYDETMIWNRSHLGEYIYSSMFREGDPKVLKDKLLQFEKGLISHKVYLIVLTADPEFFLKQEDGQSFSKNLEQKTQELKLFEEAYNFSLIPNKKMVKVDQTTELSTGTEWRMKGDNIFRPRQDILQEVINFIK